MKLVVGLGNSGVEYEKTRHNIGFMVIDKVADNLGIKVNKKKYGGLYGEAIYKGEKVLLMKPQEYINLSGNVIKKYVDYFKVEIKDLLIISDDLDMELGLIKLKGKGGTGGHKGLINIELNLHTKEYQRLKIGIGKAKEKKASDYVLAKFKKKEQLVIENTLAIACDIVLDFLKDDFLKLMNKYN